MLNEVIYIIETTIKDPWGFIYITTNLINGKKYIGQRKFTKGWKTYLGSGTLLKKAIKKYGRENFKRIIIYFGYTQDELNQLEIQYISLHNAVESDDYYNIADGGKSGNIYAGKSDDEIMEICKKISETNKKYCGNQHSQYGKPKSEITKLRISKAKRGKFVGKEHPKAKAVILLNTNEVFVTITDGGLRYNVPNCNIIRCCKGKYKSAGKLPTTGEKLRWMYYEDWLKLNEGVA